MKFTYLEFSCDVDVFEKEDGILLRFYDSSSEQSEDEIVDMVIVNSGFGFLCLKVKGESGLISGYIPYHVDFVECIDYLEYSGEC